jgi:hypothetical protein
MSLWRLRNANALIDCFRIPMSTQAFNEFLALHDYIQQLQPATNEMKDC